jgi:hypothetical protein
MYFVYPYPHRHPNKLPIAMINGSHPFVTTTAGAQVINHSFPGTNNFYSAPEKS